MRPLDTLLDRTLIGYSRIGYLTRRDQWPPDPPSDALAGRVALVTGAKTGLGRATAIGLARLGATVRMVVRGRAEGERARDGIMSLVPGAKVEVDVLDVGLLADVRRYTVDGPVDVLVHNAGLMPARRTENAEGNEVMLATHVLGPHLLTAVLRPNLAEDAKVIWVSSGGMYGQPLLLDDLQYAKSEYRPTTGYARTKRMQVVLAAKWAEELPSAVVHATHPGWADTPGVSEGLPTFRRLTAPLLRDAEQGADTTVWLAGTEGLPTGRFWHDRATRPLHYLKRTYRESASPRALWAEVQRLTGLDGSASSP